MTDKVAILESKIEELMDIVRTELDSYRELAKHVFSDGNQHGSDKIDFGLDNLHNWRQSTNQESILEVETLDKDLSLNRDATLGHRYMNSSNTHYQIEKKAMPLFNKHMADMDDPHETTLDQLDIYSEKEIRLKFSERLPRTSGAVNSKLIQGKTNLELFTEARTNISANWLDDGRIPTYSFAPRISRAEVLSHGLNASTLSPSNSINNFYRASGVVDYWSRANTPTNSPSSEWYLGSSPASVSYPDKAVPANTGLSLVSGTRFSHHSMDITLQSNSRNKGYLGVIPMFVRAGGRNHMLLVRVGGTTAIPRIEFIESTNNASGSHVDRTLRVVNLNPTADWATLGWNGRSVRVEVTRTSDRYVFRISEIGATTFSRTETILTSSLSPTLRVETGSIGYYLNNQPNSHFYNQSHKVLDLTNFIYTGDSKFTHLDQLIGQSTTEVGAIKVIPGNFTSLAAATAAMTGAVVPVGTYLIACYYSHLVSGAKYAYYGYPTIIGRKQSDGSVRMIF